MGKRELIVLLNLSSWCPVMVERLFLAVPRGCCSLVFPDHTHLLFFKVLLLYELTCHKVSLLYEVKFLIMLQIKCYIG